MGKVVLILWIAAALFAGFWFGYYQEGANEDLTLELKLGPPGGGGEGASTGPLFISGDKAAADIRKKVGRNEVSLKALVNMKDKEILLFLDPDKISTKISFDLVGSDECKGASRTLVEFLSDEGETIQRLADSRTVAGYRCHAFAPKGNGEGKMYFTYELPLGRAHQSLINRMLRIKSTTDKSTEKRKQIGSLDYFPVPLRIEGRVPGVMNLTMEVTKVTRGKIKAEVFKIPDGYTEKKPEEFVPVLLARLGGALGGLTH